MVSDVPPSIVLWLVAAHMRTDMVFDALEMARHSRKGGAINGHKTECIRTRHQRLAGRQPPRAKTLSWVDWFNG